MLKVSIIKNGQITHGAQFETQGELDAWLAKHEAQNTFGLPERAETVFNSELGIEEETGVILPAEYEIIQEDITPEFEQQNIINDKIAKGEKAANACLNVLRLIGGFNIDRELTFEQKNQMKVLFADAKEALKDEQPSYAKYFINQITPDGVLVTQEMKDLALVLLQDY